MLTPKQHELLMFINERIRERGVSPSFDEMRDALQLRSKSGVHRLIKALEARGFLRRLPYRARALEILKMPAAAAASAPERQSLSAQGGAVIRAPFQSVSRSREINPSTIEVQIMGRIAAGTPIEAIQQNMGSLDVPAGLISSGDHYALEVKGDSMIDAGIFDGDTVIIRRAETANSGDIVVALIDDQEATLKRLRRRGDSIALEAANPAYETRIFHPEQVRVQGKLVSLMRLY